MFGKGKNKTSIIKDPNPIEHYNYIQESKKYFLLLYYRYRYMGRKYKRSWSFRRTALYKSKTIINLIFHFLFRKK